MASSARKRRPLPLACVFLVAIATCLVSDPTGAKPLVDANGSSVSASNQTISNSGNAVLSESSGSQITLSNDLVTTSGQGTGLTAIGGEIDATNTQVQDNGKGNNGNHGAISEGNGKIHFHKGSSITDDGSDAIGAGSFGPGSTVDSDAPISIDMNGNSDIGIYDQNGGQTNFAPGSIVTINGGSGEGVVIDNSNRSLNGTDIRLDGTPAPGQPGSSGIVAADGSTESIQNIVIDGPGASAGVIADSGSTVDLSGNNMIDINSDAPPAVDTLPPSSTPVTPTSSTEPPLQPTTGIPIGGLIAMDGTIVSSGTDITIDSSGGEGAFAGGSSASSIIDLTGGAIVTNGSESNGLDAGGNGTINDSGTNIAIDGNGGAGAVAGSPTAPAVIDISGDKITTTGMGSMGLDAGSNGTITVDNSQISTSGGGSALAIDTMTGPGTINLDNTTVIATGATNGLTSINETLNQIDTLNITGGSLTSGADAIAARGPTDVNINNATVSGNAALAMTIANPTGQETTLDITASDRSSLSGIAIAAPNTALNILLTGDSRWTGAASPDTSVTIGPGSSWTITADSVVTRLITNVGTIAFAPPANGNFKTLTTMNYVGQKGTLVVNAALGTPGSPSDQFVIDGGSATGTTTLVINNVGTSSALTNGNGFIVVAAVNGATIAPGAFTLAAAPRVGPYQYGLFSGAGGLFLRNQVLLPQGTFAPIFRTATAIYNTAAPAARESTSVTLGSFTSFQGAPSLLDPPQAPDPPGVRNVFDGSLPLVVWGRTFGEDFTVGDVGPVGAELDGSLVGGELGLDLAQFHLWPGDNNHVGVFYAYSHMTDIGHGFVLGQFGTLFGSAIQDSHNAGVYWAHVGGNGWYVDGVVMGTLYREFPQAVDDTVSSLNGHGITGTLEGGYPFPLTDTIALETQGQLVVETIDFDAAADPSTTVRFNNDKTIGVRFGLQLDDNLTVDGYWAQPRVIFNLWHTFDGNDTTVYNGVIPIASPFEQTMIEAGAGIAARVDNQLGVYAQGTYSTSISGEESVRRVRGMIGARCSW